MTPLSPKDKPTLLEEIIERCESATGPDRRIDAAIMFSIEADDLPIGGYAEAPAYTASIDAAMTLLDLSGPFILTNADVGGKVGDYSEWRCSLVDGDPDLPIACATAPLAICAAALRARSAQ